MATKFEKNRIFILNEPNAPRLNPALAAEIGLNESLLLLQIEFWIAISNNERGGRRWTYQSVRDIHKTFTFWSESTINRTLLSLEEKRLVIFGNYNDYKYDRTRWIALNVEGIGKLSSVALVATLCQNDTRSNQNDTALCQNDTSICQNEPRSNQNETTIPETSTETSTENNRDASLSLFWNDVCAELALIDKGYKRIAYWADAVSRVNGTLTIRARTEANRDLLDNRLRAPLERIARRLSGCPELEIKVIDEGAV